MAARLDKVCSNPPNQAAPDSRPKRGTEPQLVGQAQGVEVELQCFRVAVPGRDRRHAEARILDAGLAEAAPAG